MNRRTFLQSATAVAAFQNDGILKAEAATAGVKGRSAQSVAQDEDFWFNIRNAFTVEMLTTNQDYPRMIATWETEGTARGYRAEAGEVQGPRAQH